MSSQLDRLQSQLLFTTLVTDAINQTVVDLAAIALCHRSATRAHYLIGVLARKSRIVIDTHISTDVEREISAANMDSFSLKSKLFEEELSSKWDSYVGRFVGFSKISRSDMQYLENPPFWLIYRHACAILRSRAVLEAATGFVLT